MSLQSSHELATDSEFRSKVAGAVAKAGKTLAKSEDAREKGLGVSILQNPLSFAERIGISVAVGLDSKSSDAEIEQEVNEILKLMA